MAVERRSPRVAPAEPVQPWASGQNPLGIRSIAGKGGWHIPSGFSAPTGQCPKAQRCAAPPALRWVDVSKYIATPTGLRPFCRGMPQSLSAVYIHLVFSTKHRRPLLRDVVLREALHAQLGSISKNLDCPPILVGGVEDHVHLLCRFGRTIAQAEWVKELKRVSNLWVQEQWPDHKDFQWQGGYADFSVSQSNLEEVKGYISRQEEHHRKLSFQDELRALLRRHEIAWDERYAWD
jgi:putative transposase